MTYEQQRILELETENKELRDKVASLTALVEKLLQEIGYLKHPKNSRNSSVPPLKDKNRTFKTKSLRTLKANYWGGQNGHEGSTLMMVENPDFII